MVIKALLEVKGIILTSPQYHCYGNRENHGDEYSGTEGVCVEKDVPRSGIHGNRKGLLLDTILVKIQVYMLEDMERETDQTPLDLCNHKPNCCGTWRPKGR